MTTNDNHNKELRDALLLAINHIGWCWDTIEEHTRLRREGSRHVHERLTRALAKEDK